MGRAITRRDFVGGVGVALSGSLVWSWAEMDALATPVAPGRHLQGAAAPYPPTRTGMRGSHEGSYEVAHQLRDGMRWHDPEEIGEVYGRIVVGGGISGLTTAWFFRDAVPGVRILILDNHDDFGGHAKRNEFWHEGRILLSHGGTINISNLNRYGSAAKRLIHALGIDVGRYPQFLNRELYSSLGLRRSVFFDRKTFGVDRLLVGEGEPSWREFLARTPLSEAAREEILRLRETKVNYLPEMSLPEKRDYLRHTSYEGFLLDAVKISPEAVSFLETSNNWAIGFDAISA